MMGNYLTSWISYRIIQCNVIYGNLTYLLPDQLVNKSQHTDQPAIRATLK